MVLLSTDFYILLSNQIEKINPTNYEETYIILFNLNVFIKFMCL